jgi:hypothetical protein
MATMIEELDISELKPSPSARASFGALRFFPEWYVYSISEQ